MGEAIGVAGSAVGIISLGIQAAQGILWYYRAWKDQDGDISRMCSSLDNLIGTLKVLLKTIEPPATFGKSVKGSVENSINAFHETLKKLESELEKVENTEPPKPGARSAIRRHVRRACYPFKEATLVKIQGDISEARSNLSLALDVLGLCVHPGFISTNRKGKADSSVQRRNLGYSPPSQYNCALERRYYLLRIIFYLTIGRTRINDH
jgi:hypothetical protein